MSSRPRLPLNDVLPQIRAAVADVDHDLPVRDVRTQQAQIDATVTQQKTFAVLTAAFGILALILACIGIYGLMAYDVARRTSEIGIRMALGAQADQMLRMILREASWLASRRRSRSRSSASTGPLHPHHALRPHPERPVHSHQLRPVAPVRSPALRLGPGPPRFPHRPHGGPAPRITC